MADEGVTHRSGAPVAVAKQRRAGFHAPRRAVFADVSKTSMRKIQKNVLRNQARTA